MLFCVHVGQVSARNSNSFIVKIGIDSDFIPNKNFLFQGTNYVNNY